MRPRVLVINFDPQVQPGRKLSQSLGWNDPHSLEQQYIADVAEASHGVVEYEVIERIEADEFPVKADGFRYTADSFLSAWRRGSGFHQPDGVDYRRIVEQFKIVPQVESRRIDEVWLLGFPYAGFYESIMVGHGAFWCNAPPIEMACRRFVIMGFNYERDVGCMLEDLGHRTESIMEEVYRRAGGENLWERFTRYDKTAPGRAEVGNMHFAPNSERDYDWGNPRPVISRADDWLDFPNLTGKSRRMTCADWGNGDMRAHHLWWFERLPHVEGETGEVKNDWWSYVVGPNRVGEESGSP
ncbi:MAG: hypothetical protein HY260_11855 [Chloroflexi bacterium]|nr:hypothetical protein [Chloroflexota bacterium]